MSRRSFAALGLLAACATAWSQQPWPARPITLIVPFAPGGGTDSIARDVGKVLAEKLGQPVVVDNRGGAGGALGADLVAKAKPDGYTLLFATSTFATHAAITPRLPYDPVKDFAPVAMIGRGPLLVVSAKALGLRDVPQLVAQGRAKPGGLTFCSAGEGSINHLAGVLFEQKTGLAMTHVPYKGSSPAAMDLLGGRIDVFFATVPTILPYVKDARVDLLAVTGASRSPLFPSVPTLAESGIAGYDVTTWWGVMAPAGTPAALVATLNRAVNEAAASEAVKGRLQQEGAERLSLPPEGFARALAQELALWKGVAAATGVSK